MVKKMVGKSINLPFTYLLLTLSLPLLSSKYVVMLEQKVIDGRKTTAQDFQK